MSKKERKMIFALIVIAIIVIIVMLVIRNTILAEKNEKGNKQVENVLIEEDVNEIEGTANLDEDNKLQEVKNFDGMKTDYFELTQEGNSVNVVGAVVNVSEGVKGGYPADLKILDKDGNEIITLVIYIGELQPGEGAEFITSAEFDYEKAYDYEIIKK